MPRIDTVHFLRAEWIFDVISLHPSANLDLLKAIKLRFSNEIKKGKDEKTLKEKNVSMKNWRWV
jgi:hypothetical protein